MKANKAVIGFDRSSAEEITNENADELAPLEFVDYGMEPELMGRVARCVPLYPLTGEDLRRILLELELSVFRSYRAFFREQGHDLTLDEAAGEEMIQAALDRGMAARGLNALVEEWVEPKLMGLAGGLGDYWEQVQDTVDTLQKRCLGQDVPFSQVLPQRVKCLPEADQAAWLADLLLFSLTKQVEEEDQFHLGWPERVLRNNRDWLYASSLCLSTQCNEEDRTFGNILRLIRLDHLTREVMFSELGETYEAICHQTACPMLLEDEGVELAILRLVEECKSLALDRELYRQLQTLRQI